MNLRSLACFALAVATVSDAGDLVGQPENWQRINALAIDPHDPRTLYLDVLTEARGGLFKSTDGGSTWQALPRSAIGPGSNGIDDSPLMVLSLVVSPRASDTLFAGTLVGPFKSNDGGLSWAAIRAGMDDRVGESPSDVAVGTLLFDPADATTLYAATDEGLFKSINDGQRWTRLPPPVSGPVVDEFGIEVDEVGVSVLAVDPRRPATLYAAAQGGLYRSGDAGAGWRPIGQGLATEESIVEVHALAIDPQAPKTFLAGTGDGLFRSVDGGETWSQHGRGIEGPVRRLVFDPKEPTIVYAVTGEALLRSDNAGGSWLRIRSGTITAFVLDPGSPATIYAGTETGLFKSTNRGDTWASASYGLPGSVQGALPPIAGPPLDPRYLAVLLDTDPLLQGFDERNAWIDHLRGAARRERTPPGMGSLGELLWTLGRLQSMLAEVRVSSPDAGIEERDLGEEYLRQAIKALEASNSAAGLLVAARLDLVANLSSRVWDPEAKAAGRAEAERIVLQALGEARSAGERAAAALALVWKARLVDRDQEASRTSLEEAVRLVEDENWTVARIEVQIALIDHLIQSRHEREAREELLNALAGCIEVDLMEGHRLLARLSRQSLYLLTDGWVGDEVTRLLQLSTSGAPQEVRWLALRRSWALHKAMEVNDDSVRAVYARADLLEEFDRLLTMRSTSPDVPNPVSEAASEDPWSSRFTGADREARIGDSRRAKQALRELIADIRSERTQSDLFSRNYWVYRSYQTIVEIDASSDCPALAEDLRDLVDAQKALLWHAGGSASASGFRSIIAESGREEEIFAPLLACRQHAAQVTRLAIERLLAFREIWRFHTGLLSALREARTDFSLGQVAELAELRRLRAQLRLREPGSHSLTELENIRLPASLVAPPNGIGSDEALTRIEKAIEALELSSSRLGSKHHRALRAGFNEGFLSFLSPSLGGDGVLVGYLPTTDAAGDDRLVAFVVDGSLESQWQELGSLQTLGSSLNDALVRLTQPAIGPDAAAPKLRELGAALYDPIEQALVGKRRVFLVAAGSMRFVPWNAFIDAKGRYLGERFAVTWLQSVDDVMPIGPLSDSPIDMVLMAPSYDQRSNALLERSGRLAARDSEPLTENRDEVEHIGEMLTAANVPVRVFVDEEADEDRIRSLQSPGFLHFAGHGFPQPRGDLIDDGDRTSRTNGDAWPDLLQGSLEPAFLQVGLALTGAGQNASLEQHDDLLTASEIADLDLRRTSLVVLSACNTASPSLQDIGGAYDLSHAFRIAGARSVVGSLWQVDDWAAWPLMEALYQELLRGLPIAEALRQAQEALRETSEFAHPYYWASFQVLGSGDTRLLLRQRGAKPQ